MTKSSGHLILGIGNIYLETNYLNLFTAEQNILQAGKEYQALDYEIRLGGSVANFALAAKKLGCEIGLIAKIGTDENGLKILSFLNQAGISSRLVIRSDKVKTSIDTGIVLEHNSQNIQIVSGNANQSLNIGDIDFTNPMFEEADAVYLGGFLKQKSLYQYYPALCSEFKSRSIKIFLDHGRIPVDIENQKKQILMQILPFCEGYFPNKDELLGIAETESLDKALEKILAIGPKIIAVKLGSEGCRLVSDNLDISFPAYTVKPISTVGAGDSFNAGFIASYLQGKKLTDCLRFANAVAGVRISTNNHADYDSVIRLIGLPN